MKEKNVIYGDWAATTPVLPEAAEAMKPFLGDGFGNPSSLHQAGERAKEAVERAREHVACLIGASSEEVFFTSCATESSNWVIKGTAFRALAEGSSRRRILVSAVEHPSVLRACEALAPLGFRTERIPVDENGVVSLDALSRMMGEDCLLCAVMHANNETGVIQPVRECAEIAHACGALFLCDAVQSVGHIPVNAEEMGFDFLSLSGHKLGAPKGIGGLYIRSGVTLSPLIHGGGQENGMRSGTENVPYIVAFGEACRLASVELRSGEAERIASLRDQIERRLSDLGGCITNGGDAPRVPGILNISFENVSGEGVMFLCDLKGVCISTGSACSMGRGDDVSHVLRAMGVSEPFAKGSVRISIGRTTTPEQAEIIASAVSDCVVRFRQDQKTNVDLPNSQKME